MEFLLTSKFVRLSVGSSTKRHRRAVASPELQTLNVSKSKTFVKDNQQTKKDKKGVCVYVYDASERERERERERICNVPRSEERLSRIPRTNKDLKQLTNESKIETMKRTILKVN
jgi:N-glycosylase/DNA lyase